MNLCDALTISIMHGYRSLLPVAGSAKCTSASRASLQELALLRPESMLVPAPGSNNHTCDSTPAACVAFRNLRRSCLRPA
jgi:hypothetical protein